MAEEEELRALRAQPPPAAPTSTALAPEPATHDGVQVAVLVPNAPNAELPSLARQLAVVAVSASVANGTVQLVAWACGGGRLHVMAGIAVATQYLVLLHASGNIFGNARTEKFYDLTGSSTYIAVMLFGVAKSWKTLTARQALLAVLVLVWALRLGTFLFLRIKHHGGKDRRFDDAREDFSLFFTFWNVQGCWVFLTALPAFVVTAQDNGAAGLGLLDLVGAGMWAFGFFFEVCADQQKTAWRRRPENAAKDRWIATGLWSVCRHPNYFGEITLWSGVLLVATASIAKGPKGAWTAAISPFFVCVLLLYVSGIPMLQAASKKKWGKNAGYIEFLASTPTLIPFLRVPKETVLMLPLAVVVYGTVFA